MARTNYSMEFDPVTSARAKGSELHIPTKPCREICCAIRGMKLHAAQKYLQGVSELKIAVPFKRHNDSCGHRRGPMAAGRYPEKSAKAFLKLLQNIESNALFKGLNPERMRLVHAQTTQGRTIRGTMPRAQGRATPKNTDTVNIEIVVKEV